LAAAHCLGLVPTFIVHPRLALPEPSATSSHRHDVGQLATDVDHLGGVPSTAGRGRDLASIKLSRTGTLLCIKTAVLTIPGDRRKSEAL